MQYQPPTLPPHKYGSRDLYHMYTPELYHQYGSIDNKHQCKINHAQNIKQNKEENNWTPILSQNKHRNYLT
jgi:hypothetical protein